MIALLLALFSWVTLWLKLDGARPTEESSAPNASSLAGSSLLQMNGPTYMTEMLTNTRVNHNSNFYDPRKLHTAYTHNFATTNLGDFVLKPPVGHGQFLEDVHNLAEELDPDHGPVAKLHQEDLNGAVMAKMAAENWLNAAEHQRMEGAKEWHKKIDDTVRLIRQDKQEVVKYINDKIQNARDSHPLPVKQPKANDVVD